MLTFGEHASTLAFYNLFIRLLLVYNKVYEKGNLFPPEKASKIYFMLGLN